MKTAQQIYHPQYAFPAEKETLLNRFISWCEGQEKNRFGWLATILVAHGTALTPLTLVAIVHSGNSMIFWIMAITAMGMSLVSNLAAMPTKVTIPIFMLSVLIDLAIVANCIAIGFSSSVG